MQLIILGDNEVAKGLIQTLAHEDHDLTIVGVEADILHQLEEQYDVRAIVGFPSHPDVLDAADAKNADIIIAVTNYDEVNMVACEIAHALYHTPTKIARIRASQYIDNHKLFGDDVIAIDVCISPERMVTNHIQRLIEYRGAVQVYDFANDKVRMILVKPFYGGILIGKSLADMHNYLDDIEIHIAAIFRDGVPIALSRESVIEAGDEVLFIVSETNIRAAMKAFGRAYEPNKKVIIAGGGNIGFSLAQNLEAKYQTKIIDHNELRTKNLAEKLSETTVLMGDASDKKLLLNENIEDTDVFCAVTNDDEANIMSSIQAKQLGARQAIALVKRPAYVDLVKNSEIDIAISPQQITVGSILTHIRSGDIVRVYRIHGQSSEVLELIVHEEKGTSRVIGHSVKELPLPDGMDVVALIRGSDASLILDKETIIQAEDHVLIFMQDSTQIKAIESLFQVTAKYVD
jgi:trk system potassium uptake protein